MEPVCSLPHSQVPATYPYPEPTPSIPHNPLPLLNSALWRFNFVGSNKTCSSLHSKCSIFLPNFKKKLNFFLRNFTEALSITFHVNPSSSSSADTCGWTDRKTDSYKIYGYNDYNQLQNCWYCKTWKLTFQTLLSSVFLFLEIVTDLIFKTK
jgi:hypothetical protein